MAIQSTTTPIVRPRTTLIPRTIVSTRISTNNCCPISDKLTAIYVEVKKIESLLKTNADIVRALQRRQQIETETQNRKSKEKNKEKSTSNKGKGKDNILTPPTGGGGIFQSITQFLLMNILGLAAPKIIQYAPQISWVIKNIIYLSKFLSMFTTEVFKNFVRSIHIAYRAYDTTRKIVKDIGGENFQKTFDDTSSILNKFLNAAVIVGLTVASSGSGGSPGDGRRGRGRGRSGRGRSGRGGGGSGFGSARNAGSLGTANPGNAGSGGTKLVSSGFRKILGKIQIVGPLIGFILDLIMGEPVGRAAAGAVGSLIGMGIAGALVGAGTFGIGAIAGGMIGGWIGDLIGTSLYDAVAPMAGWQVTTQAQGGAVGNKKTNVSVSTRRTKTRTKPSIQRFNKVQPGKNVGGEQEIKKLYSDPDSGKQASPYKALVRTSEILKKNSFSALMAAGVDLALGQNVDKKIFRNFADQLNYMVESSYDPDSNYGISSVNRQVLTAATGGKIPVGRTGGLAKNNFSDQLYDSMISMMNIKSNDIFSEIRKNLSLAGPDETSPGGPTSGGDNGGGSPNLIGHANATEVYNYLVNDLHFTPEAASGVLGNLLQESGAIDPRQVQHGGGNGKGILQWDPVRWGRMLSWARENNKDPYKLRTQLEWMTIEMKQRGTFNRLKGLTDVRKAVDLFEEDMQDAGVPMMEKRYGYAANAYASFAPSAVNFGRMIGTTVIDEADVANDRNPLIGLTPGEGFRQNRRSHTGIDIGTYNKRGWYVGFRMSGKVTYAGTSSGYGNLVIIKCGNIEFYFAHLASIMIKNGQQYNGETIGEIGKTGGTDDIHLHFEARPNGTPVDPRPYLKLLSLGRRLSGSAGQQPPGARQPTGTTSTGNNRPRSNALGEYQGNNDGASTSTTPQSTNIAQLAPPGQQPQSGSSAVTSVISNKTYSDVATKTTLTVLPVVFG